MEESVIEILVERAYKIHSPPDPAHGLSAVWPVVLPMGASSSGATLNAPLLLTMVSSPALSLCVLEQSQSLELQLHSSLGKNCAELEGVKRRTWASRVSVRAPKSLDRLTWSVHLLLGPPLCLHLGSEQ